MSVTIGTSGVTFAATAECELDRNGKLHAYCHAVPGMWHVMGVMLSGGGSLRWFRDKLGGEEIMQAAVREIDPYEILIEGASEVRPGCEGLFFLPYLTGERTPHADPNARGAFIGLTLRHNKWHMTRAVMEGVTFGLMDSIQLVRDMGFDVSKVRVSGGGARSELWRQMMADVFNAEVATVNITQGAAYGAALLAGVGIRVFENVQQAAKSTVRETDSLRPGADAAVYGRYYERYRALYPALAAQFSAIASLDGT